MLVVVFLLSLALSTSVFIDGKGEQTAAIESRQTNEMKQQTATTRDSNDSVGRKNETKKSTGILIFPLERNSETLVHHTVVRSVMVLSEPSADAQNSPRFGGNESTMSAINHRVEQPTIVDQLPELYATDTSPSSPVSSQHIPLSMTDEDNQSAATAAESKSVIVSVVTDPSDILQNQFLKTERTTEARLIDSRSKSQSVPLEVLSANKTSHRKELQLPERLPSQSGRYATQLLDHHNALRNGRVRNHAKLVVRLGAIFRQSTASRREFEALKAKELKSTDRTQLLNGDSSSSYRLRTAQESRSLWKSALNQLSDSLRRQRNLLADEADDRVLESQAESQSASLETVSDIDVFKRKERERLDKDGRNYYLVVAWILAAYKRLSKGTEHRLPARITHAATKHDELKSMDSFYTGLSQLDSGSFKHTSKGAKSPARAGVSDDPEGGKGRAKTKGNKRVRSTAHRRGRAERTGLGDGTRADGVKRNLSRSQQSKASRTWTSEMVNERRMNVYSSSIIATTRSATTAPDRSESHGHHSDLQSVNTLLWLIANLITVAIILLVGWRELSEWIERRRMRKRRESMINRPTRTDSKSSLA